MKTIVIRSSYHRHEFVCFEDPVDLVGIFVENFSQFVAKIWQKLDWQLIASQIGDHFYKRHFYLIFVFVQYQNEIKRQPLM